MSEYPDLWIVIAALGLGSFGLRFMFTGLLGNFGMPGIIMRHLKFAGVAVLPGLVAPLVLWPDATQGALDPPRIIAALTTLAIAMVFRRVLVAIISGAGTLFVLLWLFG